MTELFVRDFGAFEPTYVKYTTYTLLCNKKMHKTFQ